MTLTIEITPEIQHGLTREAEIRGVAVPVLAAHLLKEAVALPGKTEPEKRSSAQIRQWIDSLAEFSDLIPAMPEETFSREMIYSDHD